MKLNLNFHNYKTRAENLVTFVKLYKENGKEKRKKRAEHILDLT